MSDGIENFVYRCIDRYMAGRHHKRYGLVTSWDPQKHLAKVTTQPEGQETGWIKVHSLHMGNGWGVMVGLTPGDGTSTGDQVEITYQEGEFEAGAVTSRVHSEKDVPPTLQAGEILAKHKTGALMFMDKNGAVTINDQTTNAKIVWDGSGNITVTAQNLTINASGNVKINGTVDINS